MSSMPIILPWFPDEIWERIFIQMQFLSDVGKCSRLSKAFYWFLQRGDMYLWNVWYGRLQHMEMRKAHTYLSTPTPCARYTTKEGFGDTKSCFTTEHWPDLPKPEQCVTARNRADRRILAIRKWMALTAVWNDNWEFFFKEREEKLRKCTQPARRRKRSTEQETRRAHYVVSLQEQLARDEKRRAAHERDCVLLDRLVEKSSCLALRTGHTHVERWKRKRKEHH